MSRRKNGKTVEARKMILDIYIGIVKFQKVEKMVQQRSETSVHTLVTLPTSLQVKSHRNKHLSTSFLSPPKSVQKLSWSPSTKKVS